MIKLHHIKSELFNYMGVRQAFFGSLQVGKTRVSADPTGKYAFAKIAEPLGITAKHPQSWDGPRIYPDISR